MQNCLQTDTQSVHQHGLSVKHHTFQLIDFLNGKSLEGNWKIPEWILLYKNQIISNLLSYDIIKEYTEFHDCGKPYCLMYDNEGKRHFPDHANKSANTWLSVGGNQQAAKLMRMDMMIHTMKAEDIDEFIKNPETITLLIVGLAEIHSNANMFGGIDSTSFKIKWNQINRRGKIICQKLFGSSHDVG